MLGEELLDPEGLESLIPRAEGLGLLHLRTCFEREKKTVRVRAIHIENRRELAGYEIHMGRTNGPSATRPVFQILEEMGSPTERFDGAKSEDGLVWGTYLHGVFDTPCRIDPKTRRPRGLGPNSERNAVTCRRAHASAEMLLNGIRGFRPGSGF